MGNLDPSCIGALPLPMGIGALPLPTVQAEWGRMPVRIWSGDGLQLPPVPSSASLVFPRPFLVPSITPAAADLSVPGEPQGRGFTHAHFKGHSRITVTVAWLRSVLKETPEVCHQRVLRLREALLSCAASVQYESANEPGRQMGITDLPPEPFSEKQQRQSRMDGGEEDDGTFRELVPLTPPLEQEHLARERRSAAAANRLPLKGIAAFREVPLTAAHQSSFPWCRVRGSFGLLRAADAGVPQPGAPRSLAVETDLFQTAESGEVEHALLPNGTVASKADLSAEAAMWALHYAVHVRRGMCFNHEHACVETCVKNVKNKLEALANLRKNNAVPTCRFWFFRVLFLIKLVGDVLRRVKVRRRGKALVSEPYIETDHERNDQYRCKVKREQPFRGCSSDVAQVSFTVCTAPHTHVYM